MEDDYAAGTGVCSHVSQHRCWIGLKHEDIPSNHRVKRLLECHVAGITLAERDIVERQRGRTFPCHRQSFRCSIDSDDLAPLTDKFRSEEGYVARTTSDVKHTHPGGDSRSLEEGARYRVDEARLYGQTAQLSIGMTEYVALRRNTFIGRRGPFDSFAHEASPLHLANGEPQIWHCVVTDGSHLDQYSC
jgi:hypothetical protein